MFNSLKNLLSKAASAVKNVYSTATSALSSAAKTSGGASVIGATNQSQNIRTTPGPQTSLPNMSLVGGGVGTGVIGGSVPQYNMTPLPSGASANMTNLDGSLGYGSIGDIRPLITSKSERGPKLPTSGQAGSAGYQSQDFNFTPVSGNDGFTPILRNAFTSTSGPTTGQEGKTGLNQSGGSAFTGLLSSGGGLGTPSVFQGQQDKGYESRIKKAMSSFVDPASVMTPLPTDSRMSIPPIQSEFDVNALQKSQQQNKDFLQSREAQSYDDRAETYSHIQSNYENFLMSKPPAPEMPVQETPEQLDYLSMFPEQEKFNVREAMDSIRNSVGLPQLERQRIETINQLNATNEAFMKITDDVKGNPDLPKGLALRRIKDIQETQKERIMQLTGQLEIIGLQLHDANDAVNREFQIQQMEYNQEQQRISNNRQMLSMMIQYGAIGGFSNADLSIWSNKTGMPMEALKNLREAANKPDVKVQGSPKEGFYAIKTDKKGNITIEELMSPRDGGAFEQVTELRKEFNGLPTTKEFQSVQSSFSKVMSSYQEALTKGGDARSKAAADQALITSFNKMLDPSSVVREGEYARSVEGQSLLNRLQGKAEAALRGGTGLTDGDRRNIVDVTQRLYTDYVRMHNQNVLKYRGFAEQVGGNPANVADFIPTQGIISPQTAREGDILILDGSPYQKRGSEFVELSTNKKQVQLTPAQKLAEAIAELESGGSYSAVGPATKDGSRAYGKYQIMDFNIPSWTQEALGRALTVKEFLQSKEAQDKTAQFKIGQYLQKYYTPENVASMWFSGRPYADNYAKDVLGTSVPNYVKRVLENLKQYA
jgi:hypothetical protein